MQNMKELYERINELNENDDEKGMEALKREMLPMIHCYKRYTFSPINHYEEAMHMDIDEDTLNSLSVVSANLDIDDVRSTLSQFLQDIIEEHHYQWDNEPWSM